jgi:hypothetical protein
MKHFVYLAILILISTSCSQRQPCYNITRVEKGDILNIESDVLATFRNTYQSGCQLGETALNRYGMPNYVRADQHGIVTLLERKVVFQYNTGIIALDWQGETIWEVNSRPYTSEVYGVFSYAIDDDRVVAYTRDPLMIREYDRLTGDSIQATLVERINEDYRSGCYPKMAIGENRLLFTSHFSTDNYKLYFMDFNYEWDWSAIRNAVSQGIDEVHALACNGDQIFVGGFNEADITICDEEGSIHNVLALGYSRVKAEKLYYGAENMYYRTRIIEDMHFRNDSLWVLVGTAAFQTDSSEIWIVNLNTNEASIIPFEYSVNSFTIFDNRLVFNRTRMHYFDSNDWNQLEIEEETELCVAHIQ